MASYSRRWQYRGLRQKSNTFDSVLRHNHLPFSAPFGSELVGSIVALPFGRQLCSAERHCRPMPLDGLASAGKKLTTLTRHRQFGECGGYRELFSPYLCAIAVDCLVLLSRIGWERLTELPILTRLAPESIGSSEKHPGSFYRAVSTAYSARHPDQKPYLCAQLVAFQT